MYCSSKGWSWTARSFVVVHLLNEIGIEACNTNDPVLGTYASLHGVDVVGNEGPLPGRWKIWLGHHNTAKRELPHYASGVVQVDPELSHLRRQGGGARDSTHGPEEH
jgi:hypothetical protein